MKKVPKWYFLAVGVIVCIMGFLLFGLPVPNRQRLVGIGSVLGGGLQRDFTLVPTRIIDGADDVSNLMAGISRSPCTLQLSTIGRIMGPAVLLDTNGNPVCAVIYQQELNGIVFHDVVRTNGAFKIATTQGTSLGLQKVVHFDFFGSIRGKWRVITNE